MGKRSGSGITSRSGGGGGASVGGGGGGGSSSSANQLQQNVVDNTIQPHAVATASQANAANNARFKDTDNAPYHDLYNGRQYYQDQTFDIDTRMALQDYLNDQPMTGSMYSPSQVLNYKMRENAKNPGSQPLTANEQFMVDSLNEGMHNMGYNVNLIRYDRVDFMQTLGVGNFNNMTESQLKTALIGGRYSDPAFGSYSYNNFKNAPAGNPFTDKAVKIVRRTKASTQVLMPGNGPGGALGEIVVAPNQGVHIVDVKFTGKRGRSGANWYKQVEITVEDD